MADIDNRIPHELHNHHDETYEVLKAMPGEKEFIKAAELFTQMCDSTRLRILWIICHSEVCVNDIAAAVGMSAPAVSHHLRSLRQTGLIVGRREGKEVLYSLSDAKKAALIHKMIDDMFEMECR